MTKQEGGEKKKKDAAPKKKPPMSVDELAEWVEVANETNNFI